MRGIPQHSSQTNEHYTPEEVVEPARALLGGFDLDPASCAEANASIGASTIFTIDDDGLSRKWFGRVFLNPPGGLVRLVNGRWEPVPKNENGRYMGPGDSSMCVWWEHLAQAWLRGEVEQAFFVGFTLEILRTSQAGIPAHAFPRCYPKSRLHFKGRSPTHANVLVYLPPREMSSDEAVTALAAHFSGLGFCEAGAVTA
jgi:hypothetical protein